MKRFEWWQKTLAVHSGWSVDDLRVCGCRADAQDARSCAGAGCERVRRPAPARDARINGPFSSDANWLKKQNAQRQQEIKKDTDQLLDLATELKQYVDKTNENIISLDVIKKAEQIEKLAKSVKDKMKGP